MSIQVGDTVYWKTLETLVWVPVTVCNTVPHPLSAPGSPTMQVTNVGWNLTFWVHTSEVHTETEHARWVLTY